jgi:predicted Zn-dependent peptidase
MIKEDIRETRIENGPTILSDRMDGVRSVTLGFFFRVGSRNEPDELNGISHFIEHTVFKGTKRRSSLEIARIQDRLGGNLDAFTTHEETGFAIKVIDEKLPEAFELIADMLANPRFDEADLESEQRVIIEEMKMTEDAPDELLGELFYREFFPGHPLGLSIAGTPETVRTFDRSKTAEYHSKAFNPANLVITAAGNVDHDQLLEIFSDNKIDQDSKKRTPRVAVKEPLPTVPIIIENKPDLEQAHLMIVTPMVGGRDKRRYAADVLSNIIGGGTSSRLWQKIREDRGLAYSVGASPAMFTDCGLFSVFAATSPEQVGEVLDIVIEELRSVTREGVTEEELQLVKDQTRSSILLGLEDSASRSAALAQSEMTHGRQISVEESLANLDAVTAEDVKSVADEYFQTEKIAFAAIGELNGLKVDRERLSIR